MKRPRLLAAVLAVPLFGAVSAVAVPAASAQPALAGPATEFTVLAKDVQSIGSAQQAIKAAGGTVLETNTAVGLIKASAPATGFTERVAANRAVFGAAKSQVIGSAPKNGKKVKSDNAEKEGRGAASSSKKAASNKAVGMDPLDDQLWGLQSVRSDLSRTKQPGSKQVKVGVIDTGIDGTHPDIAPNFDLADSRNFTVDIPADPNGNEVDGPCEFRGCKDPANHDDGGHGTHVAGTIAAAANGFGVSGVAPNVTLVNIRAGQDSGYFFLQPTVDAITYAGDAGIDVVNMSFYTDPWLYNCAANPADTPAEQAEQRTIIEATQRALNYAHRKGVTMLVALGNQHTDLGAPQPDTTSPDYPANSTHPRTIDNSTCLNLPVEGNHTIGVSSFGPSQKKADYSNYGLEQISVSGPGGFFRDYFGTPWYRTVENQILSTYPKNVGIAEGNIDADGNITEAGLGAGVKKATAADGRVGYYQWLQGTSMATPHATGVAALIVSQYGKKSHGEFGMDPDKVQRVLEGTAREIACPVPRTVDYLKEGRGPEFTATCEGTPSLNSFYGHGGVDAWSAVTRGSQYLK
ncbi:S8 family serine peptidase [Amycolatopsis tolypomycina]|uniref:Serine protease, subtilisin family n=1 Tax=Amycolatopsis tolypomycina TaxID=208445 RepID=A0A1H5CCB3_9PSEU|nr:S8 family serine peptidase [Amycolatopsis tolypomycina]SED64276.1 Serine protease, subtilisin family [Amycolatopsis tolypomycina]